MDIKNLRGLVESYSEVYAPEQLDESRLPGPQREAARRAAAERRNVAAAQAPAKPTGPGGRGQSGAYQSYSRDKGRGGDAAYRAGGGDAAAKGGLTRQQIQQKGMSATRAAAKPAAPTPAAKPAPTPAAKPAPTPAAKPSAPSPSAAKVAPTAAAKPAPGSTTSKPITSQPAVSKSQSSAAEIRGMIGRSMERQAASTPTAAKPAPTPTNKATGSKKPGSIVSGFDLFDIVRGYLLDEGYAETLEEAEWMMANLIDEEAVAIILEASCEDAEDEKEMKKGKKSKKEDEDDGDEDDEELDEALTGERYKKAIKKPGARAYSRMVSADPAKRATRGGRGGESDFGAGDRGSGNKAARRAGTYQEAFESWLDEAMTNYEKNRKRAA